MHSSMKSAKMNEAVEICENQPKNNAIINRRWENEELEELSNNGIIQKAMKAIVVSASPGM